MEHTARVRRQAPEFNSTQITDSKPFIDEIGNLVQKVDKILSLGKRGKGCQFLTLHSGAADHESEWKRLRDFVVDDRTIIEVLFTYIRSQNILCHLH